MTSWRRELRTAFEQTGDDFSKMVSTMTEEELGVEFESGLGETEGIPFTAWGKKYVYFPVCYNDDEWVGWAPRNPCDIKTDHQGSG